MKRRASARSPSARCATSRQRWCAPCARRARASRRCAHPAGAGKTYALSAACEAWERSGHRVLGAATAAQAAKVLQHATGISSYTVAGLLLELDRGRGLAPRSVLVLDEAGMTGARDIERLASHAERVGAKLVLSGDDRQLPDIDAGGAFHSLARRPEAIELHETVRALEQWDRDAQLELRSGEVERWQQAVSEHGRLRVGASPAQARAELVRAWWSASERVGLEQTAMIAHRRSDVFELNQRARSYMREAHRLEGHDLDVGERSFCVGDRVRGCVNDRRPHSRTDGVRGILNGERGVVAGLDATHGTVSVAIDGAGGTVELDGAYMRGDERGPRPRLGLRG